MITLKELRRIASEPRLAEMIRVDQQLPRNRGDEGRDRFAQLVAAVKGVRKTLKQTEPWAARQAEVESEKLQERYEVAYLEHQQRLSLIAELFEYVGLEQPAPTLGAIKAAYLDAGDVVARHVRDLETMGPSRRAKLAEEVSRRGGVQTAQEPDLVVEAGRAIRDALPGLRDWQTYVDRLGERAELGIDPADWDETWCTMMDELQRSLIYPMIASPLDPDPRPELQADVEQRLFEWNLLGGKDDPVVH